MNKIKHDVSPLCGLQFAILIQHVRPGKYIKDRARIKFFIFALSCFFIISILCFAHVHRFLKAVALCAKEKCGKGSWD